MDCPCEVQVKKLECFRNLLLAVLILLLGSLGNLDRAIFRQKSSNCSDALSDTLHLVVGWMMRLS